MEEKTSIINHISPNWFKDRNKSSIWIVGYRMMGVGLKDFSQPYPTVDLGDVRVIFNYGRLSYMDANNILEFGMDHVRNINHSKFQSKETNIGGWTILMTPYACDGVQRTEQEIRESISVAEGMLSALNSINIVYEKAFENIIELSPIKISASAPIFLTSYQSPNLQPSALQILSQSSANLQALPEDMRNKVRLSLRWYSKSVKERLAVEVIDAFISIWIAIEVIGMPDTDVRPVVESLARLYQVDYLTAKDRFRLGRIHGFRSEIVHKGRMFPIHSLLISYLEAIYVDLLVEILNLPHEKRAEKILNEKGFDLRKFLNQK